MKFKNIIQNTGANLLITIFGLVGSIILARWLGPSQRGIFAAIILIPSLLQYFVNFGLSSATIYFSAKPNINKHSIWSSLFVIASIQSLFGILFGWTIIDLYLQKHNNHIIHLSRLYLATIPLGLFGMYAVYMLQGASYFKSTNILKCIVPLGYCVGILILKSLRCISLSNLIYLQLVIQSFHCLIAILLLYRLILHRFIFAFDVQVVYKMLNYGVKVWFGDVSQLANSRIDQFLIGAFLSSHDLGIYTIAISTAGFTAIFANAIRTLIVPAIAGEKTFMKQIGRTTSYFKLYWFFSLLFHVLFAIIISFLIPFVFGQPYSEAILICRILIIGSLFLNAKTVLSGAIQGMGFPEINSYVEFLGMVFSLVGSYIFVKTNGLIGASFAISFAYFSQFVGLLFFANQKGIIYKKLLFASQKEINYYLRRFKMNILQK